MIDLQKLKLEVKCLTVLRTLLSDEVIRKFLAMADAFAEGAVAGETGDARDAGKCRRAASESMAGAYAEFASELYRTGGDNLGEYIKSLVLGDENPYIQYGSEGKPEGSPMGDSLLRDLSVLSGLCALTPQDVQAEARRFVPGLDAEELFTARWYAAPVDLCEIYRQRLERIATEGYGIFAQYHTFVIHDGRIVPVKHPDAQRLEQLTDYGRERDQVVQNTLALLAGEPASNVLLYGDAGTGKSSTIKAIANEYRNRGLRLIEVKKKQLYQIPDLMETIGRNPLKFILFIDDLSFSSNDNDFAALKAILEGSIAGRTSNLVVYATSNRRHLIKETMGDREGDDIHLNDTMQELMSLSARFGLVITYQKPGKDVYLNIVRHLAAEYGVDRDEEILFTGAEAFAIRNGGRSPRVAKQFIELARIGIR